MRNKLGQFVKGNNEWIGRKHKEESKVKMSEAHKRIGAPWNKGEKQWKWKGDNVGYSGLHHWVNDNFESKKECEQCKSEINLHWANKSGQYKRERTDWLILCAKCHHSYDKLKVALDIKIKNLI